MVFDYDRLPPCVSQAGFFKRDLQKLKEEEEFKRDSWNYVPKNDKRESTS